MGLFTKNEDAGKAKKIEKKYDKDQRKFSHSLLLSIGVNGPLGLIPNIFLTIALELITYLQYCLVADDADDN